MTGQPLHELLEEYEAARLAEVKAEIAKEDALWAGLSEEEKAKAIAEREARLADFFTSDNEEESEDEDDDGED
jgi:hypothetical protein